VASTAEVPGKAADGVQRIQAVDRAIVLLKAVAASTTPATVLELARRCRINRATAWRLLRTLEHHGLVDRDVVTQRYTVGYGATVVASAVTDDALIRRVRPLLTDLSLRTGEAVTLAVARRFNLVYVDQVEPPNMMAPNWLDKPLPLHATSGGKAFLAWLGRDERDAILPADLPRYTERTVTDREQLERELTEVHRTEFAVCDPVVRGVLLRRVGGRAQLQALADRGRQRLGSGAAELGAAAARDRPGSGTDGGRDPRPARLTARPRGGPSNRRPDGLPGAMGLRFCLGRGQWGGSGDIRTRRPKGGGPQSPEGVRCRPRAGDRHA